MSLKTGERLKPGREAPALSFMVVDDDDMFNGCVVDMLASLGHNVAARAYDGESAVAIFAANYKAVDVVLMDMNMPGLNGILAAEQMRGINPLKKIVLMSGDPRNRDLASALKNVSFLHKPFNSEAVIMSLAD